MILYSLFVPSLLFYKNSKELIYLIPIDKGISSYISKGEGIYFYNLNNKGLEKTITQIYEDMLKKENIKIIFYYEIPPIWELNIFYASILSLEIISYYINNKNIKMKDVVNNAQKIIKDTVNTFPLLAYKTNFIKIFDKKFNEKRIIKKINKKYFIIIYNKTNYLLADKQFILKAKREKINEESSIKFENCSIINVSRKGLEHNMERFLEHNIPENMLITSYYKGGIKFYLHNV